MNTFSTPDVRLTPERPKDTEDIRHVQLTAFQRTNEADLVDALRAAGAITLSVVAVLDASGLDDEEPSPAEPGGLYTGEVAGGEVVGHVLFTPATVSTERGEVPLLALGPVAVVPEKQRQGIGTMMIAGCLEYLRTREHRGVVVVGRPRFYRRFGFIEASRWRLESELGFPGESFLAMALTSGALGDISGCVRYRPEFSTL